MCLDPAEPPAARRVAANNWVAESAVNKQSVTVRQGG